MQCVMTDRCYSLEDRFVSFIKLFADTWSGLIGVIETFASVKKFVQFVDVTCGAEARPSWTCCWHTRYAYCTFLCEIIKYGT